MSHLDEGCQVFWLAVADAVTIGSTRVHVGLAAALPPVVPSISKLNSLHAEGARTHAGVQAALRLLAILLEFLVAPLLLEARHTQSQLHLAVNTEAAAMFSYAALATEDPTDSAVFTAQDTISQQTHGQTLFLHHVLHAIDNEIQLTTEETKLRFAQSVWQGLPADSRTFWTHRALTARLARDRLDFLLTDGSMNTTQTPTHQDNINGESWDRPLSILSARNDITSNELGSCSLESRKRKVRHDEDGDDDEEPIRHDLDPENREIDADTHNENNDVPTPVLDLPEPLVIPPGTTFAEIQRVHAKLYRRNSKWAATFAALFKEPVAEAGRTLFICHLKHLLTHELQENAVSVEALWAAQDQASRDWWADQTSKAMTGHTGNRYIGFVSPIQEKKVTRKLQN